MTTASRRIALFTGIVAGLAGCVCAVFAVTIPNPTIEAHLDGDFLRITAQHLSFLSGKTEQRLKEGASIAFVGQLTISSDPNSVVADARSVARFALSYDIWEGKYAVVKIGDHPASRRTTVSHLSAQAAENWCLDNLTLDHSMLPADKPFYVQLDLRAEDPQDQLGIVGEGGISISRLIEVFSKPPRDKQQPHWNLHNGPYRLADLRKASHG